jgi:hypothetical protein
MPLSKSRLLAAGLLTVGLAAAAMFGHVVWPTAGLSAGKAVLGETAPAETADKQNEAKPAEGGVKVEAPHAKVDVDRDRGKVSVKAPYTDVQVDPDKGRVQVRAPYVNLDIRW